MAIPKPETLEWFPLQHRCGCIIDWGIQKGMRRVLNRLFPQLAPEPCPIHMEGTIAPLPLGPVEVRVRVPEKLWYRLAGPEKRAEGKHNHDRAIHGSTGSPGSKRPERTY
jgi:hypothetical protein